MPRIDDAAALKLAFDLTYAEDDRREQLNRMLKDRSWEDVAAFAAYHRQCDGEFERVGGDLGEAGWLTYQPKAQHEMAGVGSSAGKLGRPKAVNR